MPQGAPGASGCEIAIFSTDFIADAVNWEGLFLTKNVGGVGIVQVSKGGTGTYRDLEFWTGGAVRATIDSNGNVGINVVPTQLFETRDGNVEFGRADGNDIYLILEPWAGAVGRTFQIYATRGTGFDGRFTIREEVGSGAWEDVLTITDGNVGINENSPTAQQHITVDNGDAIECLRLQQDDVTIPFIEFSGGSIYATKTGQDEYVKVKNQNGDTRYVRLYA